MDAEKPSYWVQGGEILNIYVLRIVDYFPAVMC